MRKPLQFALLTALALSLPFASQAHAQGTDGTPLFSAERLSLGVSGNYAFYAQAGDEPLPAFEKSWEFGGVMAYNLVAQPGGRAPLLSATYSLNFDVDNKWWRHRIGATLVLWKGSD